MELEKSIFPLIHNYEVLEAILSDFIKVLEKKQPGDLHLMRKLKFMPLLIEICKRVSTCEKREIKLLGKLLSGLPKTFINQQESFEDVEQAPSITISRCKHFCTPNRI